MKVRWIVMLLGLWLVVSPFLLGTSRYPAVLWTCVIAGVFIAGCAYVGKFPGQDWANWLGFTAGFALVVASFYLDYAHISPAKWNAGVVGILAAALSLWDPVRFRQVPFTDHVRQMRP